MMPSYEVFGRFTLCMIATILLGGIGGGGLNGLLQVLGVPAIDAFGYGRYASGILPALTWTAFYGSPVGRVP